MLESHRQPTVYVDSNHDKHARNQSERRSEKIEEGCGRRIAIGMTYGGERFGQAPGDAYQRGSGDCLQNKAFEKLGHECHLVIYY